MKKIYYIFTLLITSVVFIACQNSRNVEKAEDMGKYAFNILKKFDNTSKEEYIKTIFTLEEVKEYGKTHADKISKRAQKEITNLTVKDYNGRLERDFEKIKNVAVNDSIVWNAIEYSDYTYETREEDNMKGTRGELLFKHNDITYAIKVSALNIDGVYSLIRLGRLKQN